MVVSPAFALTENPYHSIVGRNAFALKPPTLPPVLTPPPAAPANVELRGITTLLGRPQVLLNFKIPAKPPEPPKDRSLVMDVGQREGDVEVLEINPATGAVRIRNQGNELAMNLKDNAAKPQAVPSLAPALGLPAVPQPYVNPGLSAAGGVPAPAGSGATLPTRQMRSDNPSGAAPTLSEQPSSSRIEANVALYEANRAKNEELIKAGVKLPRMPVHSLLKRDPQATQP